jgi:hypothetical protein
MPYARAGPTHPFPGWRKDERMRLEEGRKQFFFEKKNQKTFAF